MNSYVLHITISTHNFCISRITPPTMPLVLSYISNNLVQLGLARSAGNYVNMPTKVYGASDATRSFFRLHINCLESFLDHMAMYRVSSNLICKTVKSLQVTQEVDIRVKPQWIPKQHQISAIEYLSNNELIVDNLPVRSRILELQTGAGKTVSSLIGIANFSKKVAIIIKPMYIEKWISDLLKTYEITEKDILVVSGSAQLMALLDMGRNNLISHRFIIISNKTIQNWFKLYEEGEDTLDLGYACLPEDFFETIGCGMRLIDEVHQDFHLNFKIDLYTNIERSISLSATMINYDPFMEKMYKLAYPVKTRYESPPLDKYVIAKELSYFIKPERKYATTEYGSKLYSHHALERSILKNEDFANNYCRLIWNTLEISFFHNYIKGQKSLIFCSSINMCTKVTSYLERKYPDLVVRRYVEDDPYENLLDSDISVSTLQSAGTAHDIPNLKTVVLTVAVNSLQSNVQSLGRLRKLKDVNTYFVYFVCQDIPKHQIYALDKQKMLRERAANFIQINAPFTV